MESEFRCEVDGSVMFNLRGNEKKDGITWAIQRNFNLPHLLPDHAGLDSLRTDSRPWWTRRWKIALMK